MTQDRGFTLVELIITVAIIAIVMSYAVPAYSRFVAQNKVQSFAYALASDLNNARSEAIRRGQT
nr:prepilin-type N-terminal cleavage/methylation domain-containing protein [Vogesella sp.]